MTVSLPQQFAAHRTVHVQLAFLVLALLKMSTASMLRPTGPYLQSAVMLMQAGEGRAAGQEVCEAVQHDQRMG